jgi:hypothetical protein
MNSHYFDYFGVTFATVAQAWQNIIFLLKKDRLHYPIYLLKDIYFSKEKLMVIII